MADSISSPRDAADVKLTSAQFPQLKRSRGFSKVTDEDLDNFRRIVPGRVSTDLAELEAYNTDWRKKFKGSSGLLLKPKTTGEVSEIMKYCHLRGLAVVPQGGNSGLVAGGVPVFDEIIISLSLMDKIISLDDISGILVCQSGCVLSELQHFLGQKGFITPQELGSKLKCQIGGNISTNAGGARLTRYGNLHGSVVGIEAVLADGTVIDCLSAVKKDNAGYDLKHLFIGAEGTLGIVTAISMLCPKKPASHTLLFLGCRNFDCVLSTYRECQKQLSEITSCVEFFDHQCLEAVEHHLRLRSPLGRQHACYMLIEVGGSQKQHDREKLQSFLDTALSRDWASESRSYTDEAEIEDIWRFRKHIAVALEHEGAVYKYDVCVPVRVMYGLIKDMRKALAPYPQVVRVGGYGHVPEGNIKLAVSLTPPGAGHAQPVIQQVVEPYVFRWAQSHGGSVSAEHGLGLVEKDSIYCSKPAPVIRLMRQVKQLLDPKGILNPYKVIPDTDTHAKPVAHL